jgi:hypothetical protein
VVVQVLIPAINTHFFKDHRVLGKELDQLDLKQLGSANLNLKPTLLKELRKQSNER